MFCGVTRGLVVTVDGVQVTIRPEMHLKIQHDGMTDRSVAMRNTGDDVVIISFVCLKKLQVEADSEDK